MGWLLPSIKLQKKVLSSSTLEYRPFKMVHLPIWRRPHRTNWWTNLDNSSLSKFPMFRWFSRRFQARFFPYSLEVAFITHPGTNLYSFFYLFFILWLFTASDSSESLRFYIAGKWSLLLPLEAHPSNNRRTAGDRATPRGGVFLQVLVFRDCSSCFLLTCE